MHWESVYMVPYLPAETIISPYFVVSLIFSRCLTPRFKMKYYAGDVIPSKQYNGLIKIRLYARDDANNNPSLKIKCEFKPRISYCTHSNAHFCEIPPRSFLIFYFTLYWSNNKYYANVRKFVKVYTSESSQGGDDSFLVRNSWRSMISKSEALLSKYYETLFKSFPSVWNSPGYYKSYFRSKSVRETIGISNEITR